MRNTLNGLVAIRPALPTVLIVAFAALRNGARHLPSSHDSAGSLYCGFSGQVTFGQVAQSPSQTVGAVGVTTGAWGNVHCPLSHGDAAGAVRRLPTPTVISMAENITTTNSFGFIVSVPLPVWAVEAISIACFLLHICSYLLAVKVIRAK
jgi:hypothetical protein